MQAVYRLFPNTEGALRLFACHSVTAETGLAVQRSKVTNRSGVFRIRLPERFAEREDRTAVIAEPHRGPERRKRPRHPGNRLCRRGTRKPVLPSAANERIAQRDGCQQEKQKSNCQHDPEPDPCFDCGGALRAVIRLLLRRILCFVGFVLNRFRLRDGTVVRVCISGLTGGFGLMR